MTEPSREARESMTLSSSRPHFGQRIKQPSYRILWFGVHITQNVVASSTGIPETRVRAHPLSLALSPLLRRGGRGNRRGLGGRIKMCPAREEASAFGSILTSSSVGCAHPGAFGVLPITAKDCRRLNAGCVRMGRAILDMKCGCHISRGFCQAAWLSRRKGAAACRGRGAPAAAAERTCNRAKGSLSLWRRPLAGSICRNVSLIERHCPL